MKHETLIALRKSRGLKQAELGKLAGVSRYAVIAWEGGKYALPPGILEKLEALPCVVEPKKMTSAAVNETSAPVAGPRPLDAANFPHLFHINEHGQAFRTLEHPFWYTTLKEWIAQPDNAAFANVAGDETHLAGHTPMSPEEALEALMDTYGMAEAEARAELVKRGAL